MKLLTSLEQFQSLLDVGADFLIFKHSGTCSISGGACKEVEITIQELHLDNIYMFDVLNTGDLKYQIADLVWVKHESPQVLIFVWWNLKDHASHGAISREWLREAL